MSVFEKDKGVWVAKFQHQGRQVWVKGGPWQTKTAAREAERRERERLEARRTEETCASFADRWLEEWPRKEIATRRQYADAAARFAREFGPTRLGEVERLSARTWALSQPRQISRIIGTMYEDARNVGLVEANPFSNLRLPTVDRTEQITPPSMDEYRAAPRCLHRPRRLRARVPGDDPVLGLDRHPRRRASRPPLDRRRPR